MQQLWNYGCNGVVIEHLLYVDTIRAFSHLILIAAPWNEGADTRGRDVTSGDEPSRPAASASRQVQAVGSRQKISPHLTELFFVMLGELLSP